MLAQEEFFSPSLSLCYTFFFFFTAMCSSLELGAELELLELLHVSLNCANCFLFRGLVNVEMERIRTVGVSGNSIF